MADELKQNKIRFFLKAAIVLQSAESVKQKPNVLLNKRLKEWQKEWEELFFKGVFMEFRGKWET